MSIYSDKLRQMINDATKSVTDITTSIENLDERVDDLEEQEDAIVNGMTNVIGTTQMPEKLNEKLITYRGNTVVYGSDYNQIYDDDGNVTDWVCWLILDPLLITRIDDDTLDYEGDITSLTLPGDEFVVGEIPFPPPPTSITRIILSSTYNEFTGKTTIIFEPGIALPNPIEEVKRIVYEYEGTNWDSDEDIINYITSWDFGHDYLHRDLGTDGTYGILDMISKLGIARGVLVNNRNKMEGSITIFEPYAT